MIRRIAALALLCFAVTSPALANGAKIVPLTAAEIPALLEPPAHGERIIMLWSLDCVYCEPNMRALAKLRQAHPRNIQFVTVATDDVANSRQAIAARLGAAGVQEYRARAYASAATAQMNFLVDPNWGGETPRTIVIRSNGTRIAISGELTPDQLRRIAPK